MDNFISYNLYKKSLALNETYESYVELQSLAVNISNAIIKDESKMDSVHIIKDFAKHCVVIQEFINNTKIGIIIMSSPKVFEKELGITAAVINPNDNKRFYYKLESIVKHKNLITKFSDAIIIIDKWNENSIIGNILHELQHAYDMYRSNGKYISQKLLRALAKYREKITMRQYSSTKEKQDIQNKYNKIYYGSKHEQSSYFVEAFHYTDFFMDSDQTLLRPIKDVYEDFINNIQGYDNLSVKEKKILNRKFFQYYYKLKERRYKYQEN